MVACSSFVDEKTKKNALDSGFKIILDVPIKMQLINDLVLP